MSTGYQPLLLPEGLDPDSAKLIRDQLEPQLTDVHAMLRLPIDGDPGLCPSSKHLGRLSLLRNG